MFAIFRNHVVLYNEAVKSFNDHDYKKALRLYRLAASKGNPNAQYSLGMFYLDGCCGLPRNINEAAKWLSKAADNGDSEARVWSLEIARYINYTNDSQNKVQNVFQALSILPPGSLILTIIAMYAFNITHEFRRNSLFYKEIHRHIFSYLIGYAEWIFNNSNEYNENEQRSFAMFGRFRYLINVGLGLMSMPSEDIQPMGITRVLDIFSEHRDCWPGTLYSAGGFHTSLDINALTQTIREGISFTHFRIRWKILDHELSEAFKSINQPLMLPAGLLEEEGIRLENFSISH